jgi:predicted nucleic acid-binding protein
VATKLGISIAGTLAVIRAAARAKLIDFKDTIEGLKQPNFRVSPRFLAEFVEEYQREQSEEP